MWRNLFILAFVFMFLSCNRQEIDDDKRSVFRYNEASGISSLDPAFSKDQAGIWACTQLFNGLVQLDSGLHVKPCIAERWEISADGKEYTFHLRNDVYFHENELFKSNSSSSGSPVPSRKVRAEDFLFSLSRLVDPKVASPGAWVMNAVKKDSEGKLVGINCPDDSTLVIELHQVFPPFLSLLSMPYCSVVPSEVVNYYGNDFRKHPCGTGPFRFSLWLEGQSLVMLKNENYFEYEGSKRLPFLDAVQISFINDKQSAFIEFLKGKLDFISGLDASYKDELLTRDGELQSRHKNHFRLQTLPYLNTEYLGILMDSSAMTSDALQNKKIRQALSYGFDKGRMITFLRNNMGTPGVYGFVPPGIPYFNNNEVKAYTYDRQKAASLLKEAGYLDGKGLPPITLSTTSAYLDLCEYIKSEWESLGFKINIDVNQAAIHRKMVAEQKLHFFRGSWIADYPDAENYLSLFYSKNFAPGGPNYTHYKNSTFDQLYEQASAEINDSLRAMYYMQMDKLVMEDAPVIILYYDKVLRLTRNNVRNLGNNAMNLLVLKQVKKDN